ncbi:ABC transporter permease [Ideonella sp. A 288]|uniref:ABC transporter permease n=1 Tax=Ideonella sp. A 288 TaxID=1962181 RepID=UPI000B4B920F|nr:FtsX-like permease family protein [Ideonella sp. A 288]
MKALDRKLLRDLLRMWSQALTIALVVASGVAGFVTTLSAVDSLAAARDRFYASGHFADVFAVVKRAPMALVAVLRETPGVADVQATLEHAVRIDTGDPGDAVIGQLIGIDRRSPPRLNRVTLRSGTGLGGAVGAGDGAMAAPTSGTDAIDALVSEAFASARGLRPGMRLGALINGKQRSLRIVGIALSPEFIFAGLGGAPDARGFGVFWVDREVLAAAYDMDGAFNHLAVKLAPGASARAVSDALSRQLGPYGGGDAHGRDRQVSHMMLDNEIKEMDVLGTVLPAIFLGVAAFLLNVVVSRVVATQREQIAALKALGYPNPAIAWHYLKLVGAITLLGWLLGLALGKWLGALLTGLYADFFRFPVFDHRIDPVLVLIAGGITLATAVLGTVNAIAATVRLAPAEAMRPPAPGRYRPTLPERLGLRHMPTALRMILRQMERRPWRTALSIGGVAASVAIVVMGNFFRDAIEVVVDSTFHVAMRSDVILWLAEPAAASSQVEIARLPGAIAVEATRNVAVRLVRGHRSEHVAIQGYAERPELRRLVDIDLHQTVPHGDGLVLTDRLAAKLGVVAGDAILVEVLEGDRRTVTVSVQALVREMMGLNAYMPRRALNRLRGEGDVADQFSVAVERGREPEFLAAARQLPRVAGAFSKATLWRNMQDISARNIRVMSSVMTLFAAVIAVGVVYNNARIALAERTWELASLRVLGFTRAEVSALLLGEMAIGIAIALPLGMLAGNALVHGVAGLLQSDAFDLPVVIRARTFAWAAICVVVAGLASALVVRRRIDRLDMVAALKTRD